VIAGGDDLIGIYRSLTGEPPWEMVLGDFCAWTLAMSPHDSKVIFAGDPYGRGVVRSIDGGITWERKISGFPREKGSVGPHWIEVSPHNPQTVHAAVRNASNISGKLGAGLWRSTDLGDHWSLVGLEGRDVQSVHVSPADAKLIFVGLGGRQKGKEGGILRSEDGGVNWSSPQIAEAGIVNVITDPEDHDRIYLAASGKGVMVSSDRGKTWRLGKGQSGAEFTWGVRQDPSNPRRLYSVVLLGGASCFASDDRGESWYPTALKEKIAIGLGINHNGAVYIGTYDMGFYRSEDQGKTWQSVESGVSHSYIYSFIAIDPRDRNRLLAPVHFASRSPGGIYISQDGGKTWQPSRTPGVKEVANAYQVTPDPRNPDLLYATCFEPPDRGKGIWESTDSGKTWHVKGLESKPCISVAVDPSRPGFLWAGAVDGLWKSMDSGMTWSETGLKGNYITSIQFHPADHREILVATGGTNWGSNQPTGFWKSSDAGEKWQALSVAQNKGAYNVAFDPGNPKRIYFAHEGGLSVSSDGGLTSVALLVRPTDSGSCVVLDPSDGFLYYAGNNYIEIERGALLRSKDQGRSWEDIGGNNRTREVWWLTVDPGRRLYASTFGSGLWVLGLK